MVAEGQFFIFFLASTLSLCDRIMGDFNVFIYLYFQIFLKWTCIKNKSFEDLTPHFSLRLKPDKA
jgi:hypothetical protein